MKVLLAYDGSLQAKNILQELVSKEKESRNRLIVLHVFNRGLFVGYDAIPGIEEMARRESSQNITEARRVILDAGARIYARVVEEEGVPEEEIIRYVENEGIDMLLCPKRFKSVMRRLKTGPSRKVEPPILSRSQEGLIRIPVHRYS